MRYVRAVGAAISCCVSGRPRTCKALELQVTLEGLAALLHTEHTTLVRVQVACAGVVALNAGIVQQCQDAAP